MLDLTINSIIKVHYPRVTHVRFFDQTTFLPREIKILSIRDLVRQPLSVEEFLRRPYVRRSRYLISGQEGQRYRQFYLGCCAEYIAPADLRLALYEPAGAKPVDLLARPFAPSVYDRRVLIRLLQKVSDRKFGDLTLRITCDDLRLFATPE